jgi:mono/diheme cytochrome c family protein
LGIAEKLYHRAGDGGSPGGRAWTRSGMSSRTWMAVIVACAAVAWAAPATRDALAAQQPRGWTLPPDVEEKKNPYPVDETLLATGRALFQDKCARCHGPGGLGDGPDADSDAARNMNLTFSERADSNPDGIVFYKIWNGRRAPRMPAFNTELTEQQVWALVAYTQTLRRKP